MLSVPALPIARLVGDHLLLSPLAQKILVVLAPPGDHDTSSEVGASLADRTWVSVKTLITLITRWEVGSGKDSPIDGVLSLAGPNVLIAGE